MRISALVLFVVCLFHFCFAELSKGVLGFAKLPKGVSIINSIDASYPDDSDLRKFDALARQAEIFAIGESAHGVAGFQNFQFRLTKYLITRHGYRRVLSEILSDDKSVNNYVTKGQGNLTQILYNNPWQGSDVEMFNFFSWIRSFNIRNPRDMVTVHTPDPQDPWSYTPIIREFVRRYDIKNNQNFTTEIFSNINDNCFGATFANQIEWAYSAETTAYYSCGCLPENKTISCVGAITYLEYMIRGELRALQQWLSKTEIDDVLYALRSMRSWQLKSASLGTDPYQSMRYREAVFGQNVLYFAERDNFWKKGSVLLAHNLHICKTTLLSTFIGTNVNADPFQNIHPVGYILDINIGNKYVAVSQTGYNVSAMFAGQFPLPTSPLSIDVALHALNRPYLLLDTSTNWVEQQGTWLEQEERIPNGRYYPLAESFDRLVFQDVALAGKFVDAEASTTEKRSHSRMIN